jgi:hypothetical protein
MALDSKHILNCILLFLFRPVEGTISSYINTSCHIPPKELQLYYFSDTVNLQESANSLLKICVTLVYLKAQNVEFQIRPVYHNGSKIQACDGHGLSKI